jgi:flagellar basal body-associated protein FliL
MKKLLPLLYKVQNAVDSALLKLLSAILNSMKALTPKWLKLNYQKSLDWVEYKKQQTKNKALTLKQQAIESKQKLLEFKAQAQIKIQELKEIEYGNKFIEYKIKIKTFRQTHSIKELVLTGLTLSLVPIKKCYEFCSSLINISANQFALVVVLSTVGTVAGINVYKISRDIKLKEAARRAPASSEPQLPAIVRPEYYKEEQRQFEIGDLKLPLHMKTANGTRSLTLDFKVTTNNRRTLQWLYDNEHRVRDWLLLHFEPIEADFPLLPEGREIVKDKILKELNNYLQHQNVEGQIKSLQLINVLGNQ